MCDCKNKKIVGEGWHQEYGKTMQNKCYKNCKGLVLRKFKIIAGSDFYVNLELAQ